MSRVFWCVGEKSNQPLWMEAFQVSVYSLEELCYLIRKKTNLVDLTLMRQDVLDFMEHALKLNVSQLRECVANGCSLSEYCRKLLDVGACMVSEEEWKKIRDILAENEEMTPFESRLRRADDRFAQKQYFAAFQAYGALATQTGDREQKALLYGRMAKAAFYLFQYRVASAFFEKSDSLSNDPDMKIGHFLCERYLMSRQEYIAYTTKSPEDYALSLRVEHIYEEAQKKAQAQADAALILPDEHSLIQEFRGMME